MMTVIFLPGDYIYLCFAGAFFPRQQHDNAIFQQGKQDHNKVNDDDAVPGSFSESAVSDETAASAAAVDAGPSATEADVPQAARLKSMAKASKTVTIVFIAIL